MPIYSFKDKNTGEVYEETMSMKVLDKYLRDNRHVEQTFEKMSIGDPYFVGKKKPEGVFRDMLKEMKKKHRGSTINTH